MYKAKRQIIKAGFVAKKGDKLPSNSTTDQLFESGYLEKLEAKKTKKKTTTHEEK